MRWKCLLGLLVSFLCIIELTNAQFTAVVINQSNNTNEQPSTSAPNDSSNDSPVTGKLRQFKGFQTPRPFPPNSANFVYSSIWASWSAWSFCTGKVQVRVRACNTVRGYSCQGPNREIKPCDLPPPRQEDVNERKESTDDTAHDSFEADRREALRQLNPGNELAKIDKPKVPTQEFRRQLSGGKTATQGPQGPPLNSIGRQPGPGLAHAPSMTPELLYEHKNSANTDLPTRKPVAFASKNTKDFYIDKSVSLTDSTTAKQTTQSIPMSQPTQPLPTIQTTKEPSNVDRDSKSKQLNAKLRDSQSVSSSVLIDNSPRTREWNTGPANQPPRLSNRQPFTRAPFNPTTQRFTPTTSRFVPLSLATTKPPVGRGDEVQITSSVQQHFKKGQLPLVNGVSASINELKFRDSNRSALPQVQSNIKEESLATALDLDESNTSMQETPKPQPNDNVLNTIAPAADNKPLTAQKPTEEDIEKMARRLGSTRLSGEAGTLKVNLHSGEVVQNKLPTMNDETAKALEWMLRNMSDATQPIAKPIELNSAVSEAPAPIQSTDIRRAFASKILPEGRFLKENTNGPQNQMPNPDEEGKQLESELSALKESMRQMESELKELRDIEDSQEPKFNIRKAINLNLVPNAPQKFKAPVMEEPRILDKPSELFLLDNFQHKSNARWSDWGPFGECFCGKRMRTRNCIYDNAAHSEGCEGRSYESVPCSGGRSCPAQRKSLSITRRIFKPETSTVTLGGHYYRNTGRFYTRSSSAETTEQPPHGDLFYPNPLPMSRRQF